jgi:asparagine synthase (glutamine-hydrolysing)
MCGIAGILTKDDDQDRLEPLIRRMQAALQHRGPDDQGIYISEDHQAAIAHTRLSILDLSPAGHQPMSTSDQRYWITFNGEIYNFQALRSWLKDQGEIFHSRTDTEVILKLYQRFGHDCLQHLRGMFAFAIWDHLEQTCFLARDPLGIKPLYYWQSGSTLVFASELRAILASRLPSIQVSPDGFYGYLTTGSVPEPFTLIEGIHTLEAGCWMQWQAGQSHQAQYWNLNFSPEVISAPDAVNKVRGALLDSIQHHFVSDVPVGIFLSGGIDSSAALALGRQTQFGELRTYSIAFEEQAWNEGDIARQVAHHFGTQHREYTVTASLGRELFPQYLAALDQPSIDGFNTFCVSQMAQQDGTKVVLSGLGGDELFGGYQSFQKIPQMIAWGQQCKKLGRFKHLLGAGLESWGQSTQMRRFGDFLQQAPNTAAAYRSFRGVFSHREACSLMAQYVPQAELPRFYPQQGYVAPRFPSIEDEISFLEISRYMRNQLLRDSDVMSMASGLELRVPFVDSSLLEAVGSIPSHLRLAAGKQLLIQALPELPEWLVNRPKRGFAFPFEQWMDQEWQGYFNQVKGSGIALNPWYRRWSLAVFEQWWSQVSP